MLLTPAALRVDEGEDGTGDDAPRYFAELTSQPTGEVTVTVTVPADSDLAVTPAALTFTAADWDDLQAVRVTAAHDDDALADAPVTLAHGVAGADYADTVAGGVRGDHRRGRPAGAHHRGRSRGRGGRRGALRRAPEPSRAAGR